MSTEERRAWLRDEILRRVAAIKRAERAAARDREAAGPDNRDAMRDALMRAARGGVSVHVVDAIVEQLVLSHREQAAKIARLRAELRADIAVMSRKIAGVERLIAEISSDPKAS